MPYLPRVFEALYLCAAAAAATHLPRTIGRGAEQVLLMVQWESMLAY